MATSRIGLTWTRACSDDHVYDLLRSSVVDLTEQALETGAEVRELVWRSYPDYILPGYQITVRW